MTFTTQDIQTLEVDEDSTLEDEVAAIQRAINSGQWGLQGSYGRAMMHALTEGFCLLGREDARDYYGNHIPSRTQVQAGTKGSYEYVAQRFGRTHADKVAAI